MSRQNLRFFLRLALLLGSLSLSHAIPSPSSNENGDTNVQASEEITSVSIVSSGGSSEPTVTSSTKVSSLTSQSDKSDSSCDFSGPKVIGYYAASDTNILPIAEIPFTTYSDLIFYAVAPLADGSFDFDGPKSAWVEKAKQFITLAKKNCVRAVLGVGGWNSSRFFSGLVSTSDKRTKFAKNLLALMDEFGFQGVDLAWLYPAKEGISCNEMSPDDLSNFAEFLILLRPLLPTSSLSLSTYLAGISGPPPKDDKTTKAYSQIIANVDYVILMTYDVFGSWSDTTGPASPFSDECNDSANKFSVKSSVQIYLGLSFKPSQLVISIASYGKGWQLAEKELQVKKFPNGLTSVIYQNHTKKAIPGGPSDSKSGSLDICGKPLGPSGTFKVRELVQLGMLTEDLRRGSSGYIRGFDECSGVPFVYSKNKGILITYDDIESVMLKTKFVVTAGLAGVAFFDVNGALPSMSTTAKVIMRTSKSESVIKGSKGPKKSGSKKPPVVKVA